MGHHVREGANLDVSWGRGFRAAIRVGAFTWTVTALAGLTAGNGILWSANRAATGTVGAMLCWWIYRRLTRRDEGLFFFATIAVAFHTQSDSGPLGPLLIWGMQACFGFLTLGVTILVLRLGGISLDALRIEVGSENVRPAKSPLWDSDLDRS